MIQKSSTCNIRAGCSLKGKAQGLEEDELGHPAIIPPSAPPSRCLPLTFFPLFCCFTWLPIHFFTPLLSGSHHILARWADLQEVCFTLTSSLYLYFKHTLTHRWRRETGGRCIETGGRYCTLTLEASFEFKYNKNLRQTGCRYFGPKL